LKFRIGPNAQAAIALSNGMVTITHPEIVDSSALLQDGQLAN
jgi:hypothetical protein